MPKTDSADLQATTKRECFQAAKNLSYAIIANAIFAQMIAK